MALSLRVAAAYFVTIALVLGASVAVSLAFRHPRDLQSGFVLCSLFPNVGNTGMPVILLAFGEAGLAIAVVLVVAQSFVSASLGTFIAARGSMTGLQPLLQVFRLPSLYSAVAAVTDFCAPSIYWKASKNWFDATLRWDCTRSRIRRSVIIGAPAGAQG